MLVSIISLKKIFYKDLELEFPTWPGAREILEVLQMMPVQHPTEEIFIQSLDIIVNSPLKRDLKSARSLSRKVLREITFEDVYVPYSDHIEYCPVYKTGLVVLKTMKYMINETVPVRHQDDLAAWYRKNFEWIEAEFKQLKTRT